MDKKPGSSENLAITNSGDLGAGGEMLRNYLEGEKSQSKLEGPDPQPQIEVSKTPSIPEIPEKVRSIVRELTERLSHSAGNRLCLCPDQEKAHQVFLGLAEVWPQDKDRAVIIELSPRKLEEIYDEANPQYEYIRRHKKQIDQVETALIMAAITDNAGKIGLADEKEREKIFDEIYAGPRTLMMTRMELEEKLGEVDADKIDQICLLVDDPLSIIEFGKKLGLGANTLPRQIARGFQSSLRSSSKPVTILVTSQPLDALRLYNYNHPEAKLATSNGIDNDFGAAITTETLDEMFQET